MSPQEKLALISVFLLMILVYILAAWGLFRTIVEKFTGIEKEARPLFIWFRRLSFCFAVLGFGCFAYANLSSRIGLKCEEWKSRVKRFK